MKKTVIFSLVVFTVFALQSCRKEVDPVVTLTQEQKDDLTFLREEEKLARDVYLYAFDKYGESIFSNIATSEQKHMDKVLGLLNTYGLNDPASAERGVFVNTTLQGLYNDLTAQADQSLIEALTVGATIEDLDIHDINSFESQATQEDILNVYEKLTCGSRNHMRGFTNNLSQNDVAYAAQFISQDELDTILASDNEQCGH